MDERTAKERKRSKNEVQRKQHGRELKATRKIEKNGNCHAASTMLVLLHRVIVEEIKNVLGKRGRCRNDTNLV